MARPRPVLEFTYEDYRTTLEDKRYELLDGDLLATPTPNPRHQEVQCHLGIGLLAGFETDLDAVPLLTGRHRRYRRPLIQSRTGTRTPISLPTTTAKPPCTLHAKKPNPGLTQPAATPYDDDVGTLIELAPLAALLAAFACWIDRRTGRRIDDLDAEFRAAHEETGRRIDDLDAEFRAAHEETGRRIDDLGQRVDKLAGTVNALVPRAAADRRTGP